MIHLPKVTLNIQLDEEFFWKDSSLQFLSRKVDPAIVTLLQYHSLLIAKKKYLTYDVGFLKFKAGDKTCMDTGWHCDGIDNNYLIICKGDFRTEFLSFQPDVDPPKAREDLRKFNISLQERFKEYRGVEAPDSTPILYSSTSVHKGRDVDQDGERLFMRICSSDYIQPKNRSLIKLLKR
jgi:hypothetical protein